MRKHLEMNDPNSCLNRADEGELLFVLRGKDRAAPATIYAWADLRVMKGLNSRRDAQIQEAESCARLMEDWQAAGCPAWDTQEDDGFGGLGCPGEEDHDEQRLEAEAAAKRTYNARPVSIQSMLDVAVAMLRQATSGIGEIGDLIDAGHSHAAAGACRGIAKAVNEKLPWLNAEPVEFPPLIEAVEFPELSDSDADVTRDLLTEDLQWLRGLPACEARDRLLLVVETAAEGLVGGKGSEVHP